MERDINAFGYVNGNPVYSRDEYIFACRKFGPIETDDELVSFAEKVTSNWYKAGHHHSFIGYYLGNYALDEPRCSLTNSEYERLRELQKIAIAEHEAAEQAREWTYVRTIHYADNSVEETWVDKDGNTKQVLVVGAHGDAC